VPRLADTPPELTAPRHTSQGGSSPIRLKIRASARGSCHFVCCNWRPVQSSNSSNGPNETARNPLGLRRRRVLQTGADRIGCCSSISIGLIQPLLRRGDFAPKRACWPCVFDLLSLNRGRPICDPFAPRCSRWSRVSADPAARMRIEGQRRRHRPAGWLSSSKI